MICRTGTMTKEEMESKYGSLESGQMVSGGVIEPVKVNKAHQKTKKVLHDMYGCSVNDGTEKSVLKKLTCKNFGGDAFGPLMQYYYSVDRRKKNLLKDVWEEECRILLTLLEVNLSSITNFNQQGYKQIIINLIKVKYGKVYTNISQDDLAAIVQQELNRQGCSI